MIVVFKILFAMLISVPFFYLGWLLIKRTLKEYYKLISKKREL